MSSLSVLMLLQKVMAISSHEGMKNRNNDTEFLQNPKNVFYSK